MFFQSEVYAKPGELMQGVLPGNKPFLLSNKSSGIFKTTTTIHQAKNNSMSQLHFKSKAAIELFWESLFAEQKTIDMKQLHITQQSNIPKGKGLSSSSTDVLGILNTLNIFYKSNYPVGKLYELAALIEPTDPCLHDEHLLFDQRNGKMIKTFSVLPFHLIYFDSEKEQVVDTIEFSKKINYTSQCEQRYQQLIDAVMHSFENKDYLTFYNCLFASAEINNEFLPKKNFSLLQNFSIKNKVGLFIAHSGTFMGLVVEPNRYKDLETNAREFINKHWNTVIYTE